MKYLAIIITAFLLSFSASAQKTSDAVQKQIKSLKADKQIELFYEGGTSKIFAKAENFADAESRAAKVEAMNFGMAIFYPGTTFTASPDTVNLTFWVLSKKPQFAGGSHWVVNLPNETLDLGESRYNGKGGLEYLNFKIKRDDLAKIAAGSSVKFKLGSSIFTFTPAHIKMFRDMLALSDTK